jgi:hypothetical protein
MLQCYAFVAFGPAPGKSFSTFRHRREIPRLNDALITAQLLALQRRQRLASTSKTNAAKICPAINWRQVERRGSCTFLDV